MKVAWSILISLVLLQGIAPAQILTQPSAQPPAPEIQVVDGKVSMSALAVPLSRIVSMLDRAMDMKSKVAPELANRPVSVRFKDLTLKEAVQKIFEGQAMNYSLIEGKGLDVSGTAAGGTTATAFDSAPITQTPLPTASPIQPAVPINAQPVPVGTPANPNPANAANPANPNPAPAANAPPPGAVAPGQLPPVPGGINPLNQPVNQPVGAPAVGTATPAVGFPLATPPPPQQGGPGTVPSGPGTVGGAAPSTPGTIVTPGTIR